MGKRSGSTDKNQKRKKVRNMLPPPTPIHRVDRTLSCASEISMSQVSPGVRETLLNMERVKIRDPFSVENQEVFQEFRESVGSTVLQELNLTEMALLLRGVMSLWRRQVGTCITVVHKLAAFVTNAQTIEQDVTKPFEGNDDCLTEKEEGIDENNISKETNTKTINTDADEQIQLQMTTNTDEAEKCDLKNPEQSIDTATKVTEDTDNNQSQCFFDQTAERGESCSKLSVQEETVEEDALGQALTVDPNISTTCDTGDTYLNSDSMLTQNPVVGLNEDQSGEPSPGFGTPDDSISKTNPDDVQKKPIRDLINTRKRILNYADLLRPAVYKLLGYDEEYFKIKKPRKDCLPPTLISCFDLQLRNNISDDDVAPILSCEATSGMKVNEKTEVVSPDNILSCMSEAKTSSVVDPCELLISPDKESIDQNIRNDSEKLGDASCLLLAEGINKLTQCEFSPEDVSEIQRWITQLHYLPFTCELTNTEVKKSFENLLQRLCEIFKKYGVPVNGHMIKLTASDVCAKITSTYPDLFQNPQENPVQSCQENKIATENSQAFNKIATQAESDLTVMERTSEKTICESHIRMREMIMEMQKSIVPKYARIPLIEENTAEFFRRVKLFEERMKKVLACEEQKEEFDVSKYEMEVLDAANRETQDFDSSDMSQDTQIPFPIFPNFVTPEKIGAFEDNFLRLGFQGFPSPSSSEASDFQKWVPFTQIFTHMKKMEKPEAARMFYAILALLSFQNLDVKYENHYSAESAAITSKSLDHAQDTKYPRGLKIMASRCPDIDREEVYLVPLTSQSRTNAFRQLETRESSLGIARMRTNSNSSYTDEIVNGDLTHDIDREFIKSECPVYNGELFKRSVSRLNNKMPSFKRGRKKLKFTDSMMGNVSPI